MVLRRGAQALIAGLALSIGFAVPTISASAEVGPADYLYDREWMVADHPLDEVVVGAQGQVITMGIMSFPSNADLPTRVYTFDKAGTLLDFWDTQIRQPQGMLLEPSGNLLIGDSRSSTNVAVRRYSPSGQLLATMELPNQYSTVSGIARSSDGTVWASDSYLDVIHRFAANGSYLGSIGSLGTRPGQLDGPTDLAILPNGDLVVAEIDNNRIQVLTPAGASVRTWGQFGSREGEFTGGPRDIAVRDDGVVYVADLERVQAFATNGTYLGQPRLATENWSPAHRIEDVATGPEQELVIAATIDVASYGVARNLPGVRPTPAPTPSPTAQPSPSPSPSPSPVPVVRGVGEVGKRVLRVKKRRLVVPVVCPAVASGGCVGTVRVKSRPKSGKARVLTKSGVYELVGSARGKVRLRVTKKGLRLLRSQRKAVVILTAEGVGVVRAKVKVRR